MKKSKRTIWWYISLGLVILAWLIIICVPGYFLWPINKWLAIASIPVAFAITCGLILVWDDWRIRRWFKKQPRSGMDCSWSKEFLDNLAEEIRRNELRKTIS